MLCGFVMHACACDIIIHCTDEPQRAKQLVWLSAVAQVAHSYHGSNC